MTDCYVPLQQHLKVESEIWDSEAKSGLFWDHFDTLVPFGTKSRIWDLNGLPDLNTFVSVEEAQGDPSIFVQNCPVSIQNP